MGGLLLRLKTWWETADKTQKLITVAGGIFLVVLIAGTFMFASRPKMSLVFANLSPADAGSVAMEIENMGIPVTFDSAGNVSVPTDMKAKVTADLAMKQKLPKGSAHYGYEQLDKMPIMTSSSVEREKIKTIMEGELAQSIEFFDGVDSANVKLTLGTDSVFESEKKPAQANVTVSERAGAMVNQDEARAMANLVASAVPGLEKNKVTIFTRAGRALWDGQDMEGSTNQANTKLDLEKAEARKRRDELQDALNRMVGPGNAIAMVDVTLNTDQVEKTKTVNTPGDPVSERKVEETFNADGVAPAGGAGLGANADGTTGANPLAGANTTPTKSGYSQVQSAKDRPLNTEIINTKKGTGELKSMGVTVLVNKTNVTDEQPIKDLVASFLPPQSKVDTSNFTSSVVSYPFDNSRAAEAKKAEDAAAASARMQQILSILPIGALLLVAFLVIKTLGKLANRPIPPTYALAGAGISGAPSLPGGAEVHTPPAINPANKYVLPEVVKQKALEAGISEEQLEAAMLEAGEQGLSIEDIPSIKSKINVPLEQIKRMATEKPEVVAMLIKSWLIEDGVRR